MEIDLTNFENKKIVWVLVVLVFGFFYIFNISASLMHDDEGTDFYEIWRLAKGDMPGVDFVAEQQPLYLLSGSLSVNLWGRTALPLRLFSFVQVMGASLLLAYVVSRIWGQRIALISIGLILTTGLVFEQSRLFRPDPMMLAWEMIGLSAVLWAVNKKERFFWSLAGASYGVAFLWKPFALFPIAGLGFYFLFLLWKAWGKEKRFEPVYSGLHFGIPFLLVGGGVSLLLYNHLGFYYGEIFSQHAGLGEELGMLDIVGRLLLFYFLLYWVNGIFALLFPLWFVNRKLPNQHSTETILFVLQLISPIIFLGISRPLYIRYFLYLIPVLSILLGWQIDLSFRNLLQQKPGFKRAIPFVIMLIFLFAALVTQPKIPRLLFERESGTMDLANYIAENTDPDDIVLADYAGLNFFADRKSIPEATIVAGAQIEGGVITGDLLMERIEEFDVQMVLVHVEGGYPPPHQLVDLPDYEEFREYLMDNFVLSTTFDRAGQLIEVYERE